MRLLPALRLTLPRPRLQSRVLFRLLAALPWSALGLLLFAASFHLPCFVATTDPDECWVQTLAYLQGTGSRFGVDVIFPYGPLSPLVLYPYDAALFWPKVLIEIAGKLTTTLLLVRLARRLGAVTGGLWLAGLAASQLLLPMPVEMLLLAGTAAVLTPLLQDRLRPLDVLIASLVLAMASLTKFTLCPFALAALGILSFAAGRQSRRLALLPLASYAIALSLCFTLAEQQLLDLPAFLKSGFVYTASYADGLAVEGPAYEVRLALLILLTLAVTGQRMLFTPAGLVLALLGGVAWKAGFVRHDAHAASFFMLMLFVPALLAAIDPAVRRGGLVLATALAGLGFTDVLIREKLAAAVLQAPLMERWLGRWNMILHPGEMQAWMERQRAELRAKHDLPAIRGIVGDERTDAFTECQGVALLNDLRLSPRSTLQSVNAVQPDWLKGNAERLRGPDAPPFLLVKWTSLDQRYPTMNDGPALLAMLEHYDLRVEERGYLLLARRASPRLWRSEVQLERTAKADEVIELPPPTSGEHRTISIQVSKTPLGSLRSLAYRPAILFFLVRDEAGEWHPFRLIAPMAQCEFLLDPLADTDARMKALFESRTGSRVTAIRLHVMRGEIGLVRSDYSLRLTSYRSESSSTTSR